MADYSAQAISNYSVDAFANFFEPDVILPSQYYMSSENGIGGGERKLMAAILSDGVEAYIAFHSRVTPVIPLEENLACDPNEAIAWVDTKDLGYVFSFDNVCQCLGIDPDYLRVGLARYVDTIRVDRSQNENGVIRSWKKIRRPRK